MSIRIRGCALRRQNSRRNFGAWLTAVGAVVFAVIVTAAPVSAESLPSVEVDLSALDQLGPARPVQAKDRITLRRPKSAPVKIAKKPAAKAPTAMVKPAPKVVKQPEPAPKVVKQPEPAPKVVKKPEPAPEVVKKPEPAPKVVKKPEPAPTKVKEPEPAPTKVKEPEPAPVAVKEPEPAAEPAPAPAKVPKPEIAKEPEAAPKPTETAAVPPAVSPGGMLRLAFASGSAELPDDAAEKLKALAAQMKNDETMRVQLRGFSASGDSAGRQARRLALSRALAVRLYLTQNGVGGTRALVRALGSETEEKPMDRVDVVVIE